MTYAAHDRPGRADAPASSRAAPATDRTSAVTEGALDRTTALEAENAALRAEASRLRRVLDAATGHAFITLDAQGRVSGWNAGARAILGWDAAEVMGRSGAMFLLAEDRDKGVWEGELSKAALSGQAVNERWLVRRDGSRFWASGATTPLRGGEGEVAGFVAVFADGSAARAEVERQALMLGEMRHRMRNLLATAQAVALHTLRRAKVAEGVQVTLGNRLMALARSHDMQSREDGVGAPLTEVVRRAVAPYGPAERLRLSGPPVRLPAPAVVSLNLVFHELATNAAKYGALSVPGGHVELRWSAQAGVVDIEWVERGGPHVAAPARRGFGTHLLEQGLQQEFGGTLRLEFLPDGVRCRIQVLAEAAGS